jgi:formiminotetrahydrofolate cyclodeaminase
MKLIDLKLDEYLDILISDEPAPGGGSVSALACAQGAALISMVCDLTTAKKKYADDHELCRQIKEEAVKLYGEKIAVGVDIKDGFVSIKNGDWYTVIPLPEV